MSERRFGSYLRYAIGEIVLIVIGILLALQINDWNADRLEQNEVRANARALVGDLEADTKMLVPVDALTHHLDQDYANDTAAITQARTTVNRVHNLNYSGLSDALAYFSRVPDDNTEAVFFGFRETDTFRRMQAGDLPLLTKVPVEVQAMVNEAIEIRDIIRLRVEVELPRLRRMAAEITKLIRSEYR